MHIQITTVPSQSNGTRTGSPFEDICAKYRIYTRLRKVNAVTGGAGQLARRMSICRNAMQRLSKAFLDARRLGKS